MTHGFFAVLRLFDFAFNSFGALRRKIFLMFMLTSVLTAEEKPFVIGELEYELGNQMFQIAAAVSVALDHDYEAHFPKLGDCPGWGLPDNYKMVFWRLNPNPPVGVEEFSYREQWGNYKIPAQPNMHMYGYYQSEMYFKHHREEILELFAPSDDILNYLESKYSTILSHPNTVALHVRTYIKDYGSLPNKDELHAFVGVNFYERAVKLFPEDALFVICSDRIDWCKENLSHIASNIVFIEDNHYVYDFYLMSRCKHNIVPNSTFSWWSAYLNPNPDKKIVTICSWYGGWHRSQVDAIVPPEWITIPRIDE